MKKFTLATILWGVMLSLTVVRAGEPAFIELNERCQASQSTEKSNSLKELPPGQYFIQNTNAEGTHHLVFVPHVPSADKYKWVSKDCGKVYKFSEKKFEYKFEPFFDRVLQERDVTPTPPLLTEMDQVVLRLCGKLGKHISAQDFAKMVEDNRNMFAPLFGSLGENGQQKFVEIWTNSNGFGHVFCGEFDKGRLEGLHYGARMQNLFERGEAGINHCNDDRDDKEGTVAVGVLYFNNNQEFRSKCRASYMLKQNAYDLFKMGTELYSLSLTNPEANTVRAGQWGGTYQFDYGRACFEKKTGIRFIVNNGGIRTLYPNPTKKDLDCEVCIEEELLSPSVPVLCL